MIEVGPNKARENDDPRFVVNRNEKITKVATFRITNFVISKATSYLVQFNCKRSAKGKSCVTRGFKIPANARRVRFGLFGFVFDPLRVGDEAYEITSGKALYANEAGELFVVV